MSTYNAVKMTVDGEVKVYVTNVEQFAARAAIEQSAEACASNFPPDYMVSIDRDSADKRVVRAVTPDGGDAFTCEYWVEQA